MADIIIPVAKDPVRARLKEFKAKVRGRQKLTKAEQEEAIERILEYLGLD